MGKFRHMYVLGESSSGIHDLELPSLACHLYGFDHQLLKCDAIKQIESKVKNCVFCFVAFSFTKGC